MQTRQLVKDGQVMLFAPPMITGYGASNGFEFNLQDKTGGDLDRFFEVAQQFLGVLNQRPEIMYAMTTFNPNFPQYMVDIDAAKCKQAGLSPSDILTTLQGYFGGLYASNFNRFGKLYRVMIQADPEARISPESLNGIMVREGAAFFYPHKGLDKEYQDWLLALQAEAIKERRGMWAEVLSRPEALKNYTGNRNSLRFFPADCPDAQKMKPRNRIHFGTLMDAFMAGYAPARVCPFWPEEK